MFLEQVADKILNTGKYLNVVRLCGMYLQMFVSYNNEPSHEKTNNLGLRPALTQTSLYSHRRGLEA